MSDNKKTKKELIEELNDLRKKITKYEKSKKNNNARQLKDVVGSAWKSLMSNIPNYIMVVDKNHNFTYINHTLPDLTQKDVIGKSIYDFITPDYHKIAREKIEKVFRTGESETYIKMATGAGGAISWYESHLGIVKENGKTIGVSMVSTDITERKRAEEAIKISQNRFQSLVTHTTDSVFCYEYNPPISTELPIEEQIPLFYQGVLVECNDVCAKTYGAERAEEVIGKSLTENFGTAPGSLDDFFRKFIEDEYRMEGEEGKEILEDGSEHYYLNRGHGVVENGKLIRVWGTFRNITERKQAEVALKESEALLRKSQAIARIGSWELNLITNQLTWSDEVYRIFGQNPHEFNASYEAFLETVHPEDRAAVDAAYYGSLRDGRDSYEIEHRIVRRDTGEVRVVHEKCEHVKDVTGRIVRSVGMVQDITERKNAETALCERETMLSSIIEHSNELFYIHDTNNLLTYVSPGSIEIFGYMPEEMMLKWTELITDNPINQIGIELTEKAITTGEKQKPYILEVMRKDGEKILLEIDESPVKDENGQVVELTGAARDITERKQAEEALRNTMEKYNILFSEANDGIVLIDALTGYIVECNRQFETISGRTIEQLKQLKIWELRPCEKQETAEKTYKKIMERGEGESSKLEIQKPDGENTFVEFKSKVISIKNKKIIQSLVRDITSRKLAEEALIESEEKYRTLISNIPNVTWTSDNNGRTSFISPNVKEVYGYTDEEIYAGGSDLWFRRIHPDDKDHVEKSFVALLKEGIAFDIEYRIQRKDGKWIWLHDKALRTYDDRGEIRADGVFSDITKHKRAEELVRIQRDLGISLGKSIDFNEVLRLCLGGGLKACEMDCGGIYIVDMETGALDLRYHEGLPEDFLAAVAHYEAGSPNTQMVMTGDPIYVSHKEMGVPLKKAEDEEELKAFATVPVKHLNRVVGCINVASHTYEEVPQFARNILEAIASQIGDAIANWQAEEALRQSEEKYRSLVETTSDWVWEVNVNGVYTYSSPKISGLLGYSPDDIVGKTPYDLMPEDEVKRIRPILDEAIKSRKPIQALENTTIHKDGHEVILETSGVAIIDEGGNFQGYRGIDRDITERKKADNALIAEKERVQNYLDIAGTMLLAIDVSGIVTLINKKGCEILGYTEDEIIGKNWFENFVPESVKKDIIPISIKLLAGKIEPAEYFENPILTKSGEERLIAWHNTILKDSDGKIIGHLSSGEDITERKKAEQEIREQSRFLNTVVASLTHPFCVINADDYTVELANAAAHSAKSPIGEYCYALDHGFDEPCGGDEHQCPLEIVKEEKKGVTVNHIHYDRDGNSRNVEIHAYPIFDHDGNVVQIIEYALDITERNQAEKLIMAQHELALKLGTATGLDEMMRICLEAMIPNTGMDCGGIYLVDEVSGSLDMEYAEGLSSEFIKVTSHYDADAPSTQLIMAGKPVFTNYDEMKVPKDAARRNEKLTVIAILPVHHENKVIACINIASHSLGDIPPATRQMLETMAAQTGSYLARAQTEEALKESETKYRTLFESSAEGILIADLETKKLLYANPAICRMLGYSRKELEMMRVSDIHPADALEHATKEFEAQARGEKVLAPNIPCLRKDGTIIYTDISAVRTTIDKKECNVGFFSDITEIKRLQELESRAQRLETAGQIAGQVAHDFNNLLGPLVAYPELIKEDLPDNPDLHDMVDAMFKASRQISEINQQLLTLGRRGHYNLEPMNINRIVEQIIGQSKYKSEKLIIRKELCSDLMNINGGESQLIRVISNIIQNASDAMQNVGELYIKTENFYLDRPHKKLSDIPIGEYVKLTVADTGVGISPEMLPKIFDPFFTTKKTDKRRGSGLGLSVVHAVIEDHNGYIDVESELGRGTIVYLYFPITREATSLAKDEAVLTGNERILIVDDDQVQRDVTVMLLKKLGYSPYVAKSGEEALILLKQNSFDLILLDMIMPGGMDGTETLKKILELKPEQKALIISGYAESESVREALNIGAGVFIKKPLTLKLIASAIRQELDKTTKIAAKE